MKHVKLLRNRTLLCIVGSTEDGADMEDFCLHQKSYRSAYLERDGQRAIMCSSFSRCSFGLMAVV